MALTSAAVLASRLPEPAGNPAEKTEEEVQAQELENNTKSRWDRSWPVIACGAGLFSDGYLNNVSDSYQRRVSSMVACLAVDARAAEVLW